jgi:hypothetical protein
MACRLILIIAIVFSVSSVFAQTPQPVQTGFVVVTPLVGFGQGLIVFGRFAYATGGDVFQSTGWAQAVVTSTALVVNSDSSSGQNTGIAIVNPNISTAANVTLTLRNDQGSIVASRSISLDALHQISQFVGELLGLGEVNVTGLLSINSTAPIALVGLQFKGTSFSLQITTVPSQVLKERASLHLMVTVSRIASGGRPRRPSSRRSSRMSLMASAKLSRASSLVFP